MISFKMQDFFHADTHPRCLRVVLSVLHQSALLLSSGISWLGENVIYLLSTGRMLTGSSLGGKHTGQ